MTTQIIAPNALVVKILRSNAHYFVRVGHKIGACSAQIVHSKELNYCTLRRVCYNPSRTA